VAVITGFRHSDDLLLDDRHLFGRQLDAEIAARHHHAIRDVEDLVEVFDGLRLLQLGNDGKIVAAIADEPPGFQHVAGGAYE
jgi:hypothetical protein